VAPDRDAPAGGSDAAAMSRAPRRTAVRYAIALDLIVIATGVALLFPPSPAAVIGCLLFAVVAGAWLVGRQGGATTTIGALIVLGFVFGDVVRLQDYVFFTLAAAAATAGIPLLRSVATHEPVVEPARAPRVPPQWLWTLALPALVALLYSDVSEVFVQRIGFSVLQLAIVGSAAVIWFYRDALQPWRILLQPLTLMLGVYAAVIFVSTVWADDLWAADEHVVKTIKSLLLYFVLAALASSWAALRRGIAAMAVTAAVLALVSVLQIGTGNTFGELGGLATVSYGTIYEESQDARAAGPLGDANFYGQILVLVLPLAAAIAWTSQRRRWQLFWLAAACVIAGGTLATYSRGAMLGIAIMTAIALWALHVPLTRVALGTAIMLVLLILAPGNVGRRFMTIEMLLPKEEAYTPPEASFERRKLVTNTAAIMWDHNPIAGVGTGNYNTFFDDYANLAGSTAEHFYRAGDAQNAHSLYLEIGAETGILGLLAFAAVIVVAYAQLRRARRDLRMRGDPNAYLALAMMIALAGYLITSTFLHGGFQRYFYILLAFAAAVSRVAALPQPAESSEPEPEPEP
jgi:putative inorganic carbon (hco3(-)) transporter